MSTQALEVFGPYRIDAREVSGGPVQHCRARRMLGAGMERPCRLRRLNLRYLQDPETQIRLLDEARLVVGLKHPGIIATEDYGIIDDELFLEEEYIAGVRLRAILDRCGPLRPGIALVVTSRLAEVLSYAHEAVDSTGRPLAVVHRNLVPHNVHITPHGETKLAGFGMAHFRGRVMRTSFGAVRDHLGYASPEELRGDPLDARSDLFGLGILLYEMMTGTVPFTANNIAEAREVILAGEYRPASAFLEELDPRVDELIASLLSQDREDRPENATAVWERTWYLWREVGSATDEVRLKTVVANADRADDITETVDAIDE